ncbi:MAG TPA: tyrosine-type recombinase/integrase [Thermoanaerobaculia bacterium]|jgi:integrase
MRQLARGLLYDAKTRTAKLSIYVQGGKGETRIRRTLHNVSPAEAEQAMAAFRARVNRGDEEPALIAPTFQEFYDRYFDLIIEGLSPSTAKDYRLVAERCLLPRFGTWRLTDITAGAVNVWIRELKRERRAAGKRPLAGATINGYANILRVLVNYAVRFDVLEESPFKKRLEREKVNRPKNELSDRECAAFLATFEDREAFVAHLRGKYRRGQVVPCERYPTPRAFRGSRRWDSDAANEIWEHFRALRPFFVVALTTGLRLGDLCRLSWKDVRWNDGWIQLVMEKTEREVVVPISAACEAALRECRARLVAGELVFVDEAGAPLSVTRIRRAFALAKQLAGITRKVRFHDLRHTYGSSRASDGLSLAIISKVMGHASQTTTARYARPDTRVFEAVREALDRRHGTPQRR